MLVLASSVEAAPSTVRAPSPVDVGPGPVTVLDGRGVHAPVTYEALAGKTIVRADDLSGDTPNGGYYVAGIGGPRCSTAREGTCRSRPARFVPGPVTTTWTLCSGTRRRSKPRSRACGRTSTRSGDAAGERTVTAPGSAGSRRSGTGRRRRRRPAGHLERRPGGRSRGGAGLLRSCDPDPGPVIRARWYRRVDRCERGVFRP